MKVVVIGGTGHVGGYLVPRLVRAGHQVVQISRGGTPRYRQDPAWEQVEHVAVDREEQDRAGRFGTLVADLQADVVIDLICFTPKSAAQLVTALRGRTGHLVLCSTIWVKGTLSGVPADEDDPSEPWGEYGIGKAEIEQLLADEGRRGDGLRSTALRPGHISGPGWPVINPAGNLDPAVWEALASGRQLTLPHFGLETLHHVHADDVAQGFELALGRTSGPTADRFNIVSAQALTLRGFATDVAHGFGREPDLRFTSFEEFRASTTPEHAQTSYEHIARSHSMSIEHARNVLGYAPAYRTIDAVAESVNSALGGQLDLEGRRLIPTDTPSVQSNEAEPPSPLLRG